MRMRTKARLAAVASFAIAIGALAQHHPVVSGIMVVVGFGFVYMAGTSRS